MIQKDGVDVEMLPDDWKRTGHVIQTCDFFAEKVFSCYEINVVHISKDNQYIYLKLYKV